MSGGNHTVVVHSRLSAAAIEPLESRTLFNAGILDLSFGFGGATTAASRNIYFRQVVEMPDHKLVAVGNFGSDIGTLAIARYLPNGQPDTTYDGDGLKTFPYQQEQAIGKVVSAVVLPGGGVAVLGSLFRVAKLTADLELDPSFGQGGFAWPFPPNSPTMASVATDLATQADGKIVVTGG